MVTSTTKRSGKPPETVRWRVMTASGAPKLVDVEVAGVFLAIAQQAEFAAFLDKNNDAEALITHVSEAAKAG